MSTVVTLRLPDELVARADGLIELIEPSEMSSASSVTRADVMRAALQLGLAQLEKKHAAKPARRKPAR